MMGVYMLRLLCFVFFCGVALAKRPTVEQRPVIKRPVPIGENQKAYCRWLADPAVSVLGGIGPAGCGKTHFACAAAAQALAVGEVDRIVITRPTVSVDEELGFLPGSMEQKMDPWLKPMTDVLADFYTAAEIRRLFEEGVMEIAPLAYMRGRTFRRSFLIADEMQNSSPNQMLMMLTRLGEGSKLVLTGDLLQSDRPGKNGLADFYERFKAREEREEREERSIQWIEFGIDDVQRSSVVASILRLYEGSSLRLS